MGKTETAIGEGLKTLRKKKEEKTIRVCDNCATPLIFTFAFDYKERYCLNCGESGGMLGTGYDTLATRERIFEKKIVDAIWKVLYGKKGFVPKSAQRSGCKKCVGNARHYDHLTKAEQEWDKIAREYLTKLQGIFTHI